MLKKHNKLIMLLVLVTFMFTIVGSAGASTGSSVEFSDVEPATVEAAAIYRLAGLKILEGYPDGTFGADNTITRAEFAKIAVYVAGLQDVATGMTGVATGYPDVPADHWASGWINVASAQGFMKGYPDGSFGPEDPITQAEVITVLMRLLGYNDNLPGVWPSNYVSQAANIEILDDVAFVSNQPATRGEVAIMASATLNSWVVEYVASDNLFKGKADPNNANQGVTLLGQSFKSTTFVKNALAIQFQLSATDEYQLVYYTFDDNQELQGIYDEAGKFLEAGSGATGAPAANTQTIKNVADECVFAGGSILDVVDRFVEMDINKDNEIISISVKDYGVVGPTLDPMTPYDEVEIKSGKVLVDGKSYDFINKKGHMVLSNIVKTDFYNEAGTRWADGKYSASDVYTLILNKNGKIAAITGNNQPQPGVVESVSGNKVTYFENAFPIPYQPYTNITGAPGMEALSDYQCTDGGWLGYVSVTDFTDEDIFVMKDRKEATLADIEPLDTLVVMDGYRGFDYFLVATSTKLPGTLEAVTYSGYEIHTMSPGPTATGDYYMTKAKVMGKNWNVAAAGLDVGASVVATIAATGSAPAAGTLPAVQRSSYQPFISLDGGDTFEENHVTSDTFDEYDLWDQDVTLLTTATGKVAGLVFGEETAGTKSYGIITDISGVLSYNGETARNVKVLKSDGKEYSYPVTDDTQLEFPAIGVGGTSDYIDVDDITVGGGNVNGLDTMLNNIATGTAGTPPATWSPVLTNIPAGQQYKALLVSVTVDSSGRADRIKIIDTSNNTVNSGAIDTDNYTIKINGTLYDAQNVVVYNAEQFAPGVPADATVVGWGELKNRIIEQGATVVPFNGYKVTGKVLEYVAINEANISTDWNYGVVSGNTYVSGGDRYVPFLGMDAQMYKKDAEAGKTAKGDILAYKLTNDEISTGTANAIVLYDYSENTWTRSGLVGQKANASGSYYTMTKISNNILSVAGGGTSGNATATSFTVDKDTKFYDVKDNNKLEEYTKDGFNAAFQTDRILVWTERNITGNALDNNDIAVVVARIDKK